ncbi:MAG: Holliday junction resolvase [Treponema sp.]|nr:Holliday junction resolvase [Treponema sp.]
MNTKTILILAATAIISFILGKLIQKLKDNKLIKKERADAVKRSRAVIGGQFTEQIAPFLPAFPCNAGDARFIGKPVDFIAFPGSAEGKSIEEILLIEVKTGDSRLSEREKQIKAAVENGNVKYVVYRI